MTPLISSSPISCVELSLPPASWQMALASKLEVCVSRGTWYRCLLQIHRSLPGRS